MEKWADYGISAVIINSEGHVNQLKVHKDKGNVIGDGELWSREQVVSALEKNYTFITLLNYNQGVWSEGQEVGVVHVNKDKYIRTDQDQTPSDNLENLPKFSTLY